jgi:hypothetical protein
MAAAISPADRTLNLVISISPLDIEAKHLASALEMRGATGGLNEILVQSRSPLRDVGGGNDHNFRPAIATRRGALTRHWRLNLNSRSEESFSTGPVADSSAIRLFGMGSRPKSPAICELRRLAQQRSGIRRVRQNNPTGKSPKVCRGRSYLQTSGATLRGIAKLRLAVIASEAKQSILALRLYGLLRRGACHRARIHATRWLLAMTALPL